MQAVGAAQEALHELMNNELTLVEQLVVVLRDEQNALVARKLDDVAQLLEGKVKLVQSVEKASRARQAYCHAAGLDSRDKLLAYLSQYSTVEATWQKLLQEARMAEMLNRSNGQLIQCHEEASRQLLQLLGQAIREDIGYTAEGRVSHAAGPSGKPLDRA